MWKLRPGRPFSEYRLWLKEDGASVVTFANMKGGVGKTTLAANFAAYASHALGKKVLIVDLDYQGSLSNMLLLAAGREEVESKVGDFLQPDASFTTVQHSAVQLDPILPKTWLVPANYELAQQENKLLVQWLLDERIDIDVRWRLAHVLLHPDVRKQYGLIVLDTAPRMTIAAINAFVCSHWLVVPSTFSKLASETVPQFLAQMRNVKKDLGIGIELLCAIGTMSNTQQLSANEQKAFQRIREGTKVWDGEVERIIERPVPRRASISMPQDDALPYLTQGAQGEQLRELLDPIFAEMVERIGLG